jgi:hypothetical protein
MQCKSGGKTMGTQWIRAKDIPAEFGIKKSKTYELLREFQAQTDPRNYIKDGKVLIVRIEEFVDWWRNRGRKND